MKVCIVAEGCYPYMVGGVSGWINSMIQSFPNIEFIVLAIVANRSMRGKFKYELPDNLTEVYEVYLEDYEWKNRSQISGCTSESGRIPSNEKYDFESGYGLECHF